jgi:hypothetical protein
MFPLSQEEIDSATELTEAALQKAIAFSEAMTELSEYLHENHVAISEVKEKEIHQAIWHEPTKIFNIGVHRLRVMAHTPGRVLGAVAEAKQGEIPGLG